MYKPLLAHRPYTNSQWAGLGPGAMVCRPGEANVPRSHAVFRVQNSYEMSGFILYLSYVSSVLILLDFSIPKMVLPATYVSFQRGVKNGVNTVHYLLEVTPEHKLYEH